MGLGDKIESAAKQLLEAQKNEYAIDDEAEQENSLEETLFSDDAEKAIDDEDFQRLRELEEEDEEADASYIRGLLGEQED